MIDNSCARHSLAHERPQKRGFSEKPGLFRRAFRPRWPLQAEDRPKKRAMS